MKNANYIIIKNDPGDPLIIKDMGPWDEYPTITNAAEEVVEDLVSRGFPPGRRLFYYDSGNTLDEILVQDGKFAGFAPITNKENP